VTNAWRHGIFAGCTVLSACGAGGEPELVRPPHEDDAGVDGSGGQRPDAGIQDADVDVSDAVVSTDAPVSPVRVGIVPVPASTEDAGPSPVDRTAALLDVLGAGARATTLVYRWDELTDDLGNPRAEVFGALESWATLHRDAGRSLLLSIALVDRTRDARPSALRGSSWDGVLVEAAARRLVDEAFTHFGSELVFLSFGNEVDRYLGRASASQGEAFVRLAQHLLDHARASSARPSALRVGVTLSVEALVAASDANAALISASDVVVASYLPREDGVRPPAPSAPATDLVALLSSLAVDGGPTPPIVLQQVGYPSASEVGSSPEAQRSFFDSLFQTVAGHREQFPFVSVYALHDLAGQACSMEVEAYALASDPNAEAFFCSVGLRTASGAPKSAWNAVLGALATFHDP